MSEPTVWDLISKGIKLDNLEHAKLQIESRGRYGEAWEKLSAKTETLQKEVEELAAKFKYVP